MKPHPPLPPPAAQPSAGQVMDPLAALREAASAREAAGLRRHLRPRPAPGGQAGPGGTAGPADLASNDYLGLGGDDRLAEAAAAAARVWGTGSTGSRLVT